MNTNELRLGNIIRYRNEYDCVVESIGSNGFSTHMRNLNSDKFGISCGSSDIEEYNGVEITEQILLKCGFVKSQAIEFGFTRPLFQYIVKRQFRWDYVIFNNDNSYSIVCDNIHYLHQLQNLYFALTGQELDCTQILHNEII